MCVWAAVAGGPRSTEGAGCEDVEPGTGFGACARMLMEGRARPRVANGDAPRQRGHEDRRTKEEERSQILEEH
ncbi:hypothetical protein NDU88_006549 [Pleurodeles waltl]|uniref:Uncharacterized protein n=1 Tax=Pleurodeles waltl TaxID=8319 RepID=A0AAV7L425_PLEWA|nr:hypothetical protein NDU88_006549 [Pleurodeles waltl]